MPDATTQTQTQTQPTPTGATGDPHLTRLDGTTFDFDGTPNATYNLLTHAGMSLHVALAGKPGATYQHWLLAKHDGPGSVLFDETGLRRIDHAGWRIDVWRDKPKDGPLAGIAHLNVFVTERPADHAGATGLLVDGTATADPLAYQVAPPPAPVDEPAPVPAPATVVIAPATDPTADLTATVSAAGVAA